MILLSEHDKDEIDIHIKSEFGVNVLVKNHDKSTLEFKNVSSIHWLDPTFANSVYIKCKFYEQVKIISLDSFYWLSFETATKIED